MTTYKINVPLNAPWPFPTAEFSSTIKTTAEPLPEPLSNGIEVVSATQQARELAVQFCHVIKQPHNSFVFNGVSIAYRTAGLWRNSKMVEVAVVYCSQHDVFNKKTGSSMAAQKFLNGNTIVIPARCSKYDDSVVSNLKELFWYCLADLH